MNIAELIGKIKQERVGAPATGGETSTPAPGG